jgi:hypothetical protein
MAPEANQLPYYWTAQPVGKDAQLLTLFCRTCEVAPTLLGGTPLVAVLRDTMGHDVPENDRVTYVWLLTYTRPNLGRRILSAVPFFYWRVGGSPAINANNGNLKPLVNVAAPRHAVITRIGRQIVQYTALDPMTMPVRATSRAYGSNEMDHERLHLEEAVDYLRSAPTSNGPSELTQTRLDTIIARLELRKKLLGGFVNERNAADLGEEVGLQEERIRSRNWELLRQCADKANLLFEPIALAGAPQRYAILWYPVGQPLRPSAASLDPIWKLLNIEDPGRAAPNAPEGPVFQRSLDSNGTLLPTGRTGVKTVSLTPLGVYSLSYRNQPLLLVDFRKTGHLRRHETTQRLINEIVSGVVGISHFTNWYYFAGADLYDFYASRHGNPMNQAARLDCYAQFRVQLALDRSLDPTLREEMQRRVNTLAINPLETAPGRELSNAAQRYIQLQRAADDGPIVKRLDNDRRAELAMYESTSAQRVWEDIIHGVTLGAYTKRVKPAEGNLARLGSYRRVEYDLAFLDRLAAAGTAPEVTYEASRVEEVVLELETVLPGIKSPQIEAHAQRILLRVRQISQDATLRADLSAATQSLQKSANSHLQVAPTLGGTR